jgi:hypothetical protein
LPALLAWALAWAVFVTLARMGAPALVALLLASLLGVAGSALGTSGWRRLFIAAGFPLSLLLSGAAAVAAWHWLLPLALLLLVYPIHAWGDAPLFPTPRDGLRGLARRVPLPDGARVLEAGCGLGDGLRALRAVYPRAQLHGLEWSWPLRALCALRCPWRGCVRATSGARTGARTSWCICSSGPRAWSGRWRRPRPSCSPAPGW